MTHIIPEGSQRALAWEVRAPVSIFELTSEHVVTWNDTREALDGFQSTNTERFGRFSGDSWYLQLGLWIYGRRDPFTEPGAETTPHLDPRNVSYMPGSAVDLLLKFERLGMTYASATRGGKVDLANVDGEIRDDVFSIGLNYWYARVARLTVDYVVNRFPQSAPFPPSVGGAPVQSPAERAIAPAQALRPGHDDLARRTGHSDCELIFRVAAAL